ncbi:hypothetical protein KKA13_00765, partial [Patescibacteria group bacterium]|nr:hypothetical protein [Patescibacteria group bacterium]
MASSNRALYCHVFVVPNLFQDFTCHPELVSGSLSITALPTQMLKQVQHDNVRNCHPDNMSSSKEVIS